MYYSKVKKELQVLLNALGYWIKEDDTVNSDHYLVTSDDYTHFYRCLNLDSVKSLHKALQEKIKMEQEGLVSRVKTMDGGYTWYVHSFQKGNVDEQV